VTKPHCRKQSIGYAVISNDIRLSGHCSADIPEHSGFNLISQDEIRGGE
jgi:hypothetical protein